jgi:acyl-CoA synthetase (AMP-forming)/AMP-acid ligase II
VRIVGRNKDMIIRGGENIYPRELEEFFFTHPAVADVQVIGIPCSRYGEEIVAWIKFHPGHMPPSWNCKPGARSASRTSRRRVTSSSSRSFR